MAKKLKGVDRELLQILACPDDKSAVKEIARGKNAGDLKCTACGRVFEVRDGIPIMLPKQE